ncbi:uncharacterized protein LOC130138213 [Syzygium oleosum]|uniref:uncharacterized protein LOC130138213 n=1 Tax=Syzygium oleosum TaxID=219896 RepID=UPI0024B97FD9|nr:uncharacterized protein LOC130138213 [Syzygium oleosum]
MRFRGKAIAWWRREKQTRQSVGKAPITSWRKMEDKIRKYFLPKGYKRELYQRYQNLRQGTRTVDQYTNEFNELVIRNNIQDPEEMLVSKYLNGLQLHIQDALEVLDIWHLGDAHQRALKVERSRSRRQQSSIMTNQPARSTPGTTKVAEATTQTASKFPNQSNILKRPTTSDIRFYTCGELGHRASNCQKNKNRQAGKAFLVDNDSDEHVEDPLEEEVNDVEESAANKLKLELKAHPTPYKMSWLSKGTEITVSKCCLVNLSIGSVYFDKIWCDVLPMDASHVILGRPWQFDRRTTHDGYRNTYSFEFGGKKIILAPSKEPLKTPVVKKSSSPTLLSMKDMKGALKGVRIVYVLLHKQHLQEVLHVLRQERLYAALEKCYFMVPQILFLGFHISAKGISVDDAKIKVIRDWPTPSNVHEVPVLEEF